MQELIISSKLFFPCNVETNLKTSCNKSVQKLLTSCVRTACLKLLEKAWNKLLTTCNKLNGLADLLQGCPNKTDTLSI